ncbi:hypothetical protein K7W42_00280 [Deinococcus sp. HMF7604]|uniref:hypothetical protein n=1 Tax=Deinococcus betulae TaxID=2873312 RepID=UPI001CCBADEE|nr:hypothetical protein [Deinococcus betulae]MBZ9749290.1 hypothetical protein [Deinococcus betulae]
MPRLNTISLRTLLTAREKLPLRPNDRIEHLLSRFRVTFEAGQTRKGVYQLMRGNLVFWLVDGQLSSLELATSHAPSDLINWCGFDWVPDRDRLLRWCQAEGIPVSLQQEESGGQLWQTPSGAHVAVQGGQLWNITLRL